MDESRKMHRRGFLARASALSGSALFGLPRLAAAEPPPETRKIRLHRIPINCFAPQYLAEELLRLEGFSTIEYVEIPNTEGILSLADRGVDLSMEGIESIIPAVDTGKRVVALAGMHPGCVALFANGKIDRIPDLKGKTVPISGLSTPEHAFISSLVAYVGLDPRRDINWVVTGATAESMRLFVEGQADAFLAGPPRVQELRARKVGKIIVDLTHDRPWSQYFCCMIVANRDFAEENPVATKRSMRALFKSADVCAREPERVARYLVAKGYEVRYEAALEVLKDLSYRRWRDMNPEDTVRFFALRMHEAKIIKSSPQKIIMHGTDWRFLNELKQELKA